MAITTRREGATLGAQTFSGSQTVQNVTTTSPGFYAQVTGDSVPRVRVGLNATDIASIAFGGGSGARDAFLERVGAANLRFGAPDVDTGPVAQTISVQNALAGGTNNVAGASFTIAGSQSKGNVAGGALIFQTSPAGSSGSTVNPLVTALSIAGTGVATFLPATAPPAAGAATAGILMSSTAALGIYFGSAAPTFSAAQGSLFIRTDGSSIATRLYVNTNGTTGWTNFVTGG